MALTNQVGSFCWWSLMSHHVSAANQFYQQLFDWQLDEIEIPDQDPSTIYVAGHGGFANPSTLEENDPTPSHWIAYIMVEDVDQSCALAETLGGAVAIPAFSIPTIGRTAVIQDPVGTRFHLFTPVKQSENFNMIGNETGEICWMELMVNNPTPLFSFYTDMFGWDFSDPMPINGGEYTSFKSHGEQVGGLMKRPPDVPEMPPMLSLIHI